MLNDRQIAAAKKRKDSYWLTDKAPGRGVGRLVLRVMPSGAKRWYYRYTDTSGKRVHLPVGDYRTDGRGVSLSAARDKAAKLRDLHKVNESKDVREYLAQQEAVRRAEEAAQRRAAEDASRNTLRTLLHEYVEHLKRNGKYSADDTRRTLAMYVLKSEYADRPAADVTASDFVELLRRITEADKGRTAAKVRSHLHAAYALAARAELDPAASGCFLRFGLQVNPISPISAMSQFSCVRDRTLTQAELRAYMRRIQAESPITSAALWLSLLLGGQRPAQVLRLRVSDVDLEARTVRLVDSKGRRMQPRVHVLPLSEAAHSLLAPIITARTADMSPDRSDFVFTTNGRVTMRIETLSSAVAAISKSMVKAKEARSPFQMRDVRRTSETMLASMGISKDLRAQILSHGIGGVQDQRYDRHDYMTEKRRALETWAVRLREIAEDRPTGGNVISIGSKAA